MSASPVPFLTPEQYLEIERAAEFKSEYIDGEMFAMSGGLLAHALLANAMGAELRSALRGKNCRAATSDLRIGVTRNGPFFHPDLSVYCGEPQLTEDYKDTLLTPTLIVEIPSPSSEAYDRGRKFAAYRRLESLREYVLVSQTEPLIETYFKQDNCWTFSEFSGPEAICNLQSLDCRIPLAEIYRDLPTSSAPV